ncbi:MAG: flavodoxin-dependent (E)-4-hydroxy-3-methylbut-2-enyl-diphosphate synthase [Clostridia bacterium]|nr:flavodoxin-dependent (E)-4-hydroxy-3-methylbut-2-enyl-diphosphate synthase [Clostridia bacterium]
MASKRQIIARGVPMGGGAQIPIQSMCSIPFSRFEDLKNQALALEKAGCDILRVSFPDEQSAEPFRALRNALSIPLVADIHYDWRLALLAMESGADKIRINPGNTDKTNLKKITDEAKARRIPIRVGVNAGSLEKDLLAKYGRPTAQALAESAQRNVELLEQFDFYDMAVSMKASHVPMMVEAYRIFAQNSPYPLHLGVTEAGTVRSGTVKSSIGIGALLLDGIGDTVRVSLTADPLEEVETAKILLRSLGLYDQGVEVISCPTCGRTTVNSIELANTVEREFRDIRAHVKVAVMGCVVNGSGEAKQADVGVTGANGEYVLFRGDKIIRHISPDKILPLLRAEVEDIAKEKTQKS